MIESLQIIFIISLCLGIAKGFNKLRPTSALSVKEPEIYFVITDFNK
jgi:hypothetical protein